MIFDRLFPLPTAKFFVASLVKAGGRTPLKLRGIYGSRQRIVPLDRAPR